MTRRQKHESCSRLGLGARFLFTTAFALLVPAALPFGAAGAPAKVKLAWWGDNDGGKRIVEEFNKSNPRVQVEYVAYPDYHQKIPIELAAGVGPDVLIFATGYFEYQRLADAGQLLDLTAYVQRDKSALQLDRWFAPPLEAARWRGKMPVLPFGWQQFGQLVYNTELFTKAGAAFPDESWSWSDMLAAAKKLSADANNDGRPDQWGLVPYQNFPGWQYLGQSYIHAAGGQVFDPQTHALAINSRESVSTLQMLLQPAHETDIFDQYPPGWEVQPWIDGKAAMVVGWAEAQAYAYSSQAKFIPGNVPIPLHPDTKRRSPMLSVSSLGINAATKEREAAWEFVRFFSSVRGQEAYADGIGFLQHLPVSRTVLQSRAWLNPPKAPKGINPASFVKAAEAGHVDIPFSGWQESQNVLRELWLKAWNREITIVQMVEEATTRVNQILKEAH